MKKTKIAEAASKVADVVDSHDMEMLRRAQQRFDEAARPFRQTLASIEEHLVAKYKLRPGVDRVENTGKITRGEQKSA